MMELNGRSLLPLIPMGAIPKYYEWGEPPPPCSGASGAAAEAAGAADCNPWRHRPAGPGTDPGARWESAERMRRDDDLYALGMVVAHNPAPAAAGRGSAIFLHVWRGPGSPTSGCTSISRADLLQVLTWLRPDARPLLVQAPWSALRGLGF